MILHNLFNLMKPSLRYRVHARDLKAPFNELEVGEYTIKLTIDVYNQSDDLANASLVEDWSSMSKEIDFELEINSGGFFGFLPFVDSESHRKLGLQNLVLEIVGPQKTLAIGAIC